MQSSRYEQYLTSENPYMAVKPYSVGTQKNRLSETILLSTHNLGFSGVIKQIFWAETHVFFFQI